MSTPITPASKKGFTLLFGVLITGLLLSMVLTIAGIVVRQLIISGVGRESQIAFYAADSALECARYYDRDGYFNTAPTGQLDLRCNDETFVLSDYDDTVICQSGDTGNDQFCPEDTDLDAQEQVYRKFVYGTENITSNQNSPEADFVIMKRIGPGATYADNRSTITANGRNTNDEAVSRRVERTLKETYLPSFLCTSASTTPDPSPSQHSVKISAWRVSCGSEEDLPNWSNWIYQYPNLPNNPPYDLDGDGIFDKDDIDLFVQSTHQGNGNYNCKIHADACFEYSYATADALPDPSTNTGFYALGQGINSFFYISPIIVPGDHPGSANDYPSPGSQSIWYPFDNASTLNGPAKVTVDPEDDFITKLRVRTLLQPGEHVFTEPNALGDNEHQYGSTHSSTKSAEMICYQDGTNFDNTEYIGERRANGTFTAPQSIDSRPLGYFCAAFTTPGSVNND